MSDDEKKGKGSDFTKGLWTGIGTALGIAALGIGGKLLYDTFKEDPTPNKDEEDEKEESNNNSIKCSKINTTSTKDEEIDVDGRDSFICPINQTLMEDPVITPYGTTYERSAILNWLKKHDTDPLTKKRLTKDMLITNYALRSAIQEYKQSLNK